MAIPEPEGLSFEEWARRLRDEYPDEDMPYPRPATEWKSWAREILMRNTFGELFAIDPLGFDTWQLYAQRMKQQLGN